MSVPADYTFRDSFPDWLMKTSAGTGDRKSPLGAGTLGGDFFVERNNMGGDNMGVMNVGSTLEVVIAELKEMVAQIEARLILLEAQKHLAEQGKE